MAFLSILTLYNYDSTIFDNFNVPAGMDKTTAVNNICMECAEMALVYPDLDIMKLAIKNWSDVNAAVWQKLYNTTQLVYNPIWNVDATISETNSGRNDGGTTESVKGYNSDSWAEHNKNVDGSMWSESKSMTRQGNIGVTASQDLINKEREVALFNIYKEITNSFKKQFCLMIY